MEENSYVNQSNHYRNLDQRPNDCSKGGTTIDPENSHSNGDCKLKIAAGCGKGQCSRFVPQRGKNDQPGVLLRPVCGFSIPAVLA